MHTNKSSSFRGCFCYTQNQRNRGDETWPGRRTRE
nr:MAG TPA: hypothetical protein [Caudoviricetes sp.]